VPGLAVGTEPGPARRAGPTAPDRPGALGSLRRYDEAPARAGAAHAPAEVGAAGGALSPATTGAVASLLDRGSPLPAPLRSAMESAFETDLGSVRLHTGEASARLNEAVHARAFTVGRTIFYGGAAADLQTGRGRQVLAHEVAHVLQNRRVGESTGRRTIRRFDVSLEFFDDPDISNARVSGLAFNHRPGDTFVGERAEGLGGDPYGTRRHLVSWALEKEYYQETVRGRTISDLVGIFGASAPTKQRVEAAIKARIAGEREHRFVHQGSKQGNEALGQMEQQGKAELRRPGLLAEDVLRAHVKAFLGAIDMPSGASQDPNLNRQLLEHTVTRAATFYVRANRLPDQFRQPLIDRATERLWNPQAGRYRSGDEIGTAFRPYVLAGHHGLPPSASGMVSQLTHTSPQPLSGPPMQSTLPWNQPAPSPFVAQPHALPLLPGVHSLPNPFGSSPFGPHPFGTSPVGQPQPPGGLLPGVRNLPNFGASPFGQGQPPGGPLPGVQSLLSLAPSPTQSGGGALPWRY
jgi:hypothetical protein